MTTSFFRILLWVCAGGFITIMGNSQYGATPLLTVAGLSMLSYGMYRFLVGMNLSDKAESVMAAIRPALPCRNLNHSGCQDDPSCVCGCHRERIEIKVH